MIDAEYRSEERFFKLSLAYEGKEEGKLVCSTVDNIIKQYDFQPEMYTCNISEGKEVVVIEYHDDITRQAGVVFEKIMKELNIKKCI